MGDEAIEIGVEVSLEVQLRFEPDHLVPSMMLALGIGPVILKDRESELFSFNDDVMNRLHYLRVS